MKTKSQTRGFSIAELLVAMTVVAMVLGAVLAIYTEANSVRSSIESSIKIQSNVRLALDRMARELRMTGFGVPLGAEVGGTAVWTPAIFHASQTEIGIRGDVDGGFAEIVCTPKSGNFNCPRNRLRLDSIRYYQQLKCKPPDGSAGNLRLIASLSKDSWESVTCSATTVANGSITVPNVTDDTFTAGRSYAATLEQVSYRYIAGSAPTFGSLIRHVRYDNTPSGTFPPSGGKWTTLANHLTDFWIEYQDENGTVLSTYPLSSADRTAVRKIVMYMEGFDQAGPKAAPQLIQARSEILVRNPEPDP